MTPRPGAGPFLTLLAALVALFGLYPFFAESRLAAVLFQAFFSAVLLAGVLVTPRTRGHLAVGVLLAVSAIGTRWLAYGTDDRVAWLAALGLTLLLLGLTMVSLLYGVLSARRVSADTIYGAICVYLLLGAAWATGFAFLEVAQSGAFRVLGKALQTAEVGPQLLYYSLVTLTTLGYGDVVPATPPARMLSTLAAISGQLYLAILIARLVGLHVAQGWRDDA